MKTDPPPRPPGPGVTGAVVDLLAEILARYWLRGQAGRPGSPAPGAGRAPGS